MSKAVAARVVLIDEYDKPVPNVPATPEVAQANRDYLPGRDEIAVDESSSHGRLDMAVRTGGPMQLRARERGHRRTSSQYTSSQPWNTTIRPVKRTPGNCRANRSSAR